MPYEEIPYTVEDCDLPPEVKAFIDEADRRCDLFYDQKLNKRYPRYVPSEPAQVYAALRHVTEQGLPLGETFIEWGSGFGVATGIAAQLGYQAYGIEIEETLVEKAESLLADQGLDAEFSTRQLHPRRLHQLRRTQRTRHCARRQLWPSRRWQFALRRHGY